MLAEVLLVLAGHPSSFFVPSPAHRPTTLTVSPDLQNYLHPGETSSLNALGDLAFRYRRIRQWAQTTQRAGRDAILRENSKGKHKAEKDALGGDVYMSTLASEILESLKGYELLIVEIETKILSMDPEVVQDRQGYVPLSILVATFSSWQAPLFALSDLVNKLSVGTWTPGKLIEEISERGQSGNPILESLFGMLLAGLRTLFLTHLIAFLLHGHAPASSSSTNPSIGIDAGHDPLSPQHRTYVLNEDLIPQSIGRTTRESLLYVGRVAATLRREGRELPTEMISDLRDGIRKVKGFDDSGGLGEALTMARADVGE